MQIIIEYRRTGLTQKQHLLNCINPSPLMTKKRLRRFFADTEIVECDNIDDIFEASLRDIPDIGWELHQVIIPDLKLTKHNPYTL